MKKICSLLFFASIFLLFFYVPRVFAATGVTDRMAGYIMLQVEARGEAWYIDPVELKRYYLANGDAAYSIMRKHGLGISEADFARLEAGNSALLNRLSGRIVLRVEQHGEAYYIYPKDKSIHYLANGKTAYGIMRKLGLGITTQDLNTIPKKMSEAIGESPTFDEEFRVELYPSEFQKGLTLDNVSFSIMGHYWLQKVNQARRNQGLPDIAPAFRFVDTATEWAAVIGETEIPIGVRPNGQLVHDWIAERLITTGVDNTEQRAYLEHIGWTTMDDSLVGAYQALDAIYTKIVTQPGVGSQSFFGTQFNSYGAGFYIAPTHDGHYMLYAVFHYGEL